jgi:hypothetical protein
MQVMLMSTMVMIHQPQKRNDLIIKIQILTKMLFHNCQLMVTRRCRLSVHPFKGEMRMHQSPYPKTNIIELQLATDDDRKYISQFCLSRKTLICQKHHFPFLFYVQQLHNRIALLLGTKNCAE